ncbi:hypothetical protein VIMY103929_03190 [Vibrio mytili]|uniref:Pilus assembly protein PapC n=2 Tax=Vibrio mytili TaxID=50718 RepID=A0A0C3IBV6_9VIBR|nr:hypothetical protein SU60_04485 [Vibrio mytili]
MVRSFLIALVSGLLCIPFAIADEFPIPTDVSILGKTLNVKGFVSVEDENYWALDGNDLLEKTHPILEKTVHDFIVPYFENNKVTSDLIEQVGWKSHYDLDNLVVTLDIPLDATKAQDIHFTPQYSSQPPDGYTQVQPSFFSGVMNVYATHTQNINKLDEFTDSIALRTAMTFGSVVFEDGHSYFYSSQGSTPGFQRDATRIMYQTEDKNSLFQLGDYISQSEIVSLGSGDIFGLAYSRQPSYLNGSRRGNSVPISLETPSLVRVSINGEEYRTLRLAPGQYNLRDLPVDSGTNEIKVEFVDQNGISTERYLNVVNRPELLYSGDVEAQVVAGVEQEYVDGAKEIYKEQPAAQGMVAYGLNQYWTASLWGEWLEEEQQFGLLQNVALGNSFVTLDLSTTQNMNSDSYKALTSLYYPDVLFGFLKDINLSHSYNQYYWSNGGATTDQNLGFSTAIYTPSDFGYLSFSSGIRWRGNAHQRTYASINSSYRLFSSLRASLNLRWEDSDDEPNQYSAYLSFSMPLGSSDYSVDYTTRYNTEEDEIESSLSASRYDIDNYWRASVNFVDKEYDSASLSYRNRHPRANSTVRLTSSRETSGDPLRTMEVGVETGIAWAGSNVTVTSPVNSGFALVSLSEEFENYALTRDKYNRVKIVPKEEASSSTILVPVYNNSQRLIKVNSENLDFNEELKAQRYSASSGLRQGSEIVLDKLSGFFVTGLLVNDKSQPLIDVVGELSSPSSNEAYPFYTDDFGQFELDMVPEGQYLLSLYGVDHLPYKVNIRESMAQEGIFIELNEIQLRHQ